MIEMKTSELEGKALDWAVAKCNGKGIEFYDHNDPWLTVYGAADQPLHSYTPSTDWGKGGPLIEGHRVSLTLRHDGWWIACVYNINDEAEYMQLSDCPLEAAMRCLVASKLGDTVQVPKELLS